MGKEPFQWVCFKLDKRELFLEPSTQCLFQGHGQGFGTRASSGGGGSQRSGPMCPPTLENSYQDAGCLRSAPDFRTTKGQRPKRIW